MIRRAVASDAAAIMAIWNRVIKETTITFSNVAKTERDVLALIQNVPCLVAQRDGTVNGFATFGPFRAGPGYADAAEHSIYLDPPVHGQGVGYKLLSALETEASAMGIRHLVAGIAGTNVTARVFHTKAGFDEVGVLPGIGQKFGVRHDLVLMMKKLAVPS